MTDLPVFNEGMDPAVDQIASAKVENISASARNGESRGGESPFVKGNGLGFTPSRFMQPDQRKIFLNLPVKNFPGTNGLCPDRTLSIILNQGICEANDLKYHLF